MNTLKFVLRHNFLIFIVFLCITFFLFLPALRFDFIIDDWALLWVSALHPGLFGIYWAHPATVAEFFLFTKVFGVNPVAFNTFGFFLRACIGFVGYLFLSFLTKSKKVGFLFGLFLISSYLGLQSTTWASAHIVSIDLICIVYTTYRYIIFSKTPTKQNTGIFFVSFLLTLIADPGRNFPIIGILLFLLATKQIQENKKFIFQKINIRFFSIIVLMSTGVFLLWDTLFGYFFNTTIAHHHTHIPLETLQYYFGSLGNMILDPFFKTFEFASDNTHSYAIVLISLGISVFIGFGYFLYKFFTKKSQLAFLLSFLFFGILLFYIPNWFSYPRLFVPAIHRYLTISGFGLLALITMFLAYVYKQNKLIGIFLFCFVLLVNIITLMHHVQQEATFRGKNLVGIWNAIATDIPKSETDTIFYFTGDEPLLTWGMVYSEGNPFRLSRKISDPKKIIIVTNILEKIANYLCHSGIRSLDDLKSYESILHFRSWNISANGGAVNTTNKETINLENVYQQTNACDTLEKQYGKSFTYFN